MSDWLNYFAALVESGHPIDGDLASQIINEVIYDRSNVPYLDEETYPEAINFKPDPENK